MLRLLIAAVAWATLATVAHADVTVEEGPGWVALANAQVRARLDIAAAALTIEAAGVSVGPLTPEARVDGTLLAAPGSGLPEHVVIDVQDALGSGKTVTVTMATPPHELALEITVRADRPEVTAAIAVRAGTPATIESFALRAPASATATLGADLRVLAEERQSWIVPYVGDLAGAPAGTGLAAVHGPTTDRTLVLGALSQARSVRAVTSPDLAIEGDGPPTPTAAGQRIVSDLFAITLAAGANGALEAHADAVAATAGASAPTAPSWGWMTWYASSTPDEGLVARAADSLAAIDAGRNEAVVITDDGWQLAVGNWQANARFPSGMPALAAMASARSLRSGLWLAPFGVAESSAVAQAHPEWLVEDGAGEPHVIEDRPAWGGRIFRLDPSVAGVNEWLGEEIRRITVDWGFALVKIDFLEWGLVEPSRARPGSDPRAAFAAALEAMRAAAAPGTVFLLSGMPLAFAPGRGELARSSPDAFEDFGHHQAAFRSAARRAHQNGAAYWADADVLMVRQGLDDRRARRRVAFMAAVGGPVFLGDLIFVEPPDRLALAQRLLPPHPYRGRPLDLFTAELPSLWELPLGRDARLHTVLSFAAATSERSLPPPPDGPRLYYDVWNERAVGTAAGPIAFAFAADDAFVAVSRASPAEPCVLATSGHLVGAAMNVTAAAWSWPELALGLRGHPHEELRVMLAVPELLRAVASTAGTPTLRADGLVELTATLDDRGQSDLTVTFAVSTPVPIPSGRPIVTAPAGVRVAYEEEIRNSRDLDDLLAAAAAGTFIVVLPPPVAAPAPTPLDEPPWLELTAPDVTTTATAGSLAAALAAAMSLPSTDTSGVLLNVRPGFEPPPVLDRPRVRRATHAVIASGAGALIRLGRLDDTVAATVIERLGEPEAQATVRAILGRAVQLRQRAREALDLDGPWRFATDPDSVGDAQGWAHPAFDDSAWGEIDVPGYWESLGFPGYDGVAWYRRKVAIPRSWRGLDLLLELRVDDQDTTSFAGAAIGTTTSWIAERRYPVPAAAVAAGADNTIAVRVTDHGQGGGILSSVRLMPDPRAVAAKVAGGELIAFLDASDLRSTAGAATLLAVREGTAVRLTIIGGKTPFTVARGDFPHAPAPAPLAGSPFSVRTVHDPAPGPERAYRLLP